MSSQSVIVGEVGDLHVGGVVTQLERRSRSAFIVDAPRLRDLGFSFDGSRLGVGSDEILLMDCRGWLRRYAPNQWGAGAKSGSLEAVTTRAFLGLVGSISRTGQVSWLTPLDAMLRAEDRLFQLRVASELGVRTPKTLVTSRFDEALAALGPTFVAKPLVGGYFVTEDGPFAVHAAEMSDADRGRVDFGAAPFVAQEKIEAKQHLRVVTVGARAWAATLSAAGRPLDWRSQESAHSEWVVDESPDTEVVCRAAVDVTRVLGIGFSSQDWITDGDSSVFVDLNPGGQWMFLPEPIATGVCAAIAGFLAGDD